jgi:hypothetical protein
MKNLLVFVFTILSVTANCQILSTPDQVIQKYLEVTKIKDNSANITDMVMSYTSESPRGVAETDFKYMFPFKCNMSVFANGMELMSATFDGEKMARKSNWGGGNQPPKTGASAIAEGARFNPFIETDYVNLKFTTSLLPNETIESGECYVVEIKDTEGKTWKDYYDTKTGFKTKTFSINESPRGKVESTILYENYKAFKGSEILFSAVKKQTSPMGEISSELQSVKINKGLKAKDFEIK